MFSQDIYIWLEQLQGIWQPIQNYINEHQLFLFGNGTVLVILGFGWRLFQQNRKSKILLDTFPFEVIKPQSNALQVILGGDEKDPLADFNIPYQDRVAGRNIQDELKKELDENRWILIVAPTGWGKTREAANLANRLNQEGWTILKLKRGEWLEAPPIFPEDKIGTDRKLIFFLDDLNNKMYGGRFEQSPKANEPLQPLNKSLQERLFDTLEAYEKFCRKEEIRVIATARNETERESSDEPSEWEKLEFDKHQIWRRFKLYTLPAPDEQAIIRVLRETILKINIPANKDDFSRIAQRNDRTFRNIVENLRIKSVNKESLTLDNFTPTLKGTWEQRYQKVIKLYPSATYIYDAVDLLRQFNIKLYRFTVEATAQMLRGGNFLERLLYRRKLQKSMDFLIDSERILEPRDGQIEAKGKHLESRKYSSLLLGILVNLARKYPNEISYSLFNFGYELYQLDGLEEALTALNVLLNIKPDDYEAWYNKGFILSKLEKKEEAIIAFHTAIKYKPDDYEAWYNQGVILSELGRIEEAIIAFCSATKYRPSLHEAWNNKGILLSKSGRKVEAITAFNNALSYKPDFHLAWNNQGILLSELGRRAEAITAFNNALNYKPDYYEAWNNQGIVLVELEKLEQALVAFNNALNYKSDYHEAWYNKGAVLVKLERKEEALVAFNNALNCKPDFCLAWNDKGILLYELGKKEEALTAFDHAIRCKSDYHQYWYNKGVLLYNLERKEEAIMAYDYAISCNNNYHLAWYNKACCYALIGNINLCIDSLQQAIALNSDYIEKAKNDSDFDNIRENKRFQNLINNSIYRENKE